MKFFGNKFDKLANQMDEETLGKLNEILNSSQGQKLIKELSTMDKVEIQKKFEGMDLGAINMDDIQSKFSDVTVNEVLDKLNNADTKDFISKIVGKEE